MKIKVCVKANAKEEQVELVEGVYHVRVKARPIDGQANEAVIKVLSEFFKVPKSQVQLCRGATSKFKYFEVG